MRSCKHTWFIRAHPPTGVTDVRQAFTFSSGITVGPAKATPSKSKDAVFQAGMKWGAPAPKPGSTEVDEILDDTQIDDQSDAEMPPPSRKDGGGSQDTATKMLHTPPKENHAKAKKAKVCKPPAVPWHDHFTAEANDFQSGKASRTDPQDFAPAGRLQAALRMIASKQIRDSPQKYIGGNADQTAKAGVYAEHIALAALANASHLDIGHFCLG